MHVLKILALSRIKILHNHYLRSLQEGTQDIASHYISLMTVSIALSKLCVRVMVIPSDTKYKVTCRNQELEEEMISIENP